MNTALDPWNDAGLIAKRLSQEGAALFVIVGAEQWCEKCRELRPHFDAFLAHADNQATWLWLDLEDHAEFIGDFMPESLPMLIAYIGDQLISCHVLEVSPTVLDDAITQFQNLSPSSAVPTQEPGIRARLLQQDWAD